MNNFKAAYEYFDFLFSKISQSKAAYHNIRCVLKWFIPLKILRGSRPSHLLCERYDLMNYFELAKIIRKGEIGQFETHINQNFFKYMSLGVIDLIMKLKLNLMRNFVKRCTSANAQINPNTPFNLRYTLLRPALDIVQSTLSLEAFEFELCNLIMNKYITGVISPGVGLSLSKTNPFPSIEQILENSEGRPAFSQFLVE